MTTDNPTDDGEKNVCTLSAGDLELIADGERVGPWLFDGEPVYVELDSWEVEKVRSLETGESDDGSQNGGK